MADTDSSASMVLGSHRADADLPDGRAVGAPGSVSQPDQPTVISASSAGTDTRQTSSSDLSHSTSSTDMADADLTPLTWSSSAGFGSQERSTVSESRVPAEPAARTAETDAQNAVSAPLASDVRSNGSSLTAPPDSPSAATTPRVELVPGQKRTASGEVKPSSHAAAPQSPGANCAVRGRRTMSTGSHGSRIAELSAHLRARLSYAAAKVERSWQSRGGDDRDHSRQQQGLSPTSSSTIRGPKHTCGSPRTEMSRSERQYYSDSPEGIASSAPDSFMPHNSNFVNGSSRISPASPMEIMSPPRSISSRPSLPPPQTAPLDGQQTPRLAPPADIVPSSGGSSRRRPNPNGTYAASNYDPYPRHRRYSSQQELQTWNTSNSNTVPETPPLQNSQFQSGSHSLTPSVASNFPLQQRTPSQNALMEQDAIETLLFMSSPENSGHYPGSRQRHTNLSTSIETQAGFGLNGIGPGTQGSQASEHNPPRRVSFADGQDAASAYSARKNSAAGLEDQGGDEIDRMLDQMDSDSEDERR